MPLVAAMFFIAVLALQAAIYVPEQEARYTYASADVSATSALAYRESVINFLNANPGFSGTVLDSQVTFLWGYQRDLTWTNLVANGTLYIYELTPTKSMTTIDRIYTKTQRSYMVGRKVGGFLVSAKGFGTGISVPAAIPEGSILIVGK